MFFFFTCGTHVFNSKLAGAEHITVQCQNCGNFSGRCVTHTLPPISFRHSILPHNHTPVPIPISPSDNLINTLTE
jgi:hypothetical protein